MFSIEWLEFLINTQKVISNNYILIGASFVRSQNVMLHKHWRELEWWWIVMIFSEYVTRSPRICTMCMWNAQTIKESVHWVNRKKVLSARFSFMRVSGIKTTTNFCQLLMFQRRKKNIKLNILLTICCLWFSNLQCEAELYSTIVQY